MSGIALHRLSSASIELELLPAAGARVHRLKVFGQDVLRTPGDPHLHARDPFFWGAYHMAPWCNRLETRPVQVGRRTIELTSNFRDGTAIHGQVYQRPWIEEGDGRFSVSAGGNGWPWPYTVRVLAQVGDRSVSLAQTVTNRADESMPTGLGWHPWFRKPVEVAIRAATVIPSNSDPAATRQPVLGAYDLRQLEAMAADLDATWTDLAQPAVELRWSDIRIRAMVRIAAEARFVAAASPRDIDAVAVETQTHAPFGLSRTLHGRHGGLALLEPGGSLTLTTDLEFNTLQEDSR
jgi:aldose 1-epimerase